LKDRIKEIYLSGFDEDEKIYIVKHFIWPECMNQYGLTENNIIISDDLIKEINRKLTVTEEETGVRYLKKFYQSLLDNLVLRITSKPEGFEAFFGKAADKCEEQATYVSPMTPEFPFEVQITDVYFLTDA
jgi:ATP-dependent Lon protease